MKKIKTRIINVCRGLIYQTRKQMKATKNKGLMNQTPTRFRLYVGIGIIIILGPIVLFTIFKPGSTEAEWFNDDWGFRKKIPVTNSSGETKQDFQISFTEDTVSLVTAGKIQSDCDDIRITDVNGRELDYWIEPTTCNTSATIIWTKVPSIPSSGANIYFYYGNPSVEGKTSAQNTFVREMTSAVANWPLDDTTTDQSYARVLNPADAEGRDIVINGGFDSDTVWSKGTGWTISGGVASSDGSQSVASNLYQDLSPMVKGNSYSVTFSISNYSAGTLKPYVGDQVGGTARSANGTYTETITYSTGTLSRFYLQANADFVGSVDDVIVKQVDIPSSGDFDGTELLTDGDMEAVDTSAWDQYGGTPVLSKETTNPHGGTRVLRIMGDDVDNITGVSQDIFTVGKKYRVTGYVRSDGTARPTLTTSGSSSIFWTGTTSTDWQAFDVLVIADNAQFTLRQYLATSTNYTEWDDVSVTEISPLSGAIPTSASGNRPTIGADSSPGHLSNAFTFDGSNDYVNIYSSDLNSVFNPNEGTLVAWAKVSGAGVYSDSTYRRILYIGVDANNRLDISRYGPTNNTMQGGIIFGGTNKSINATYSGTGWTYYAISWSKSADQFKFYINSDQVGSTSTGLGTWTGNVSSSLVTIGSGSTSGINPWSGDINDVRLYSRALSADEISDLYSASEDRQAYYTDNYEGYELIRNYDDTVSAGTLGSEEVGPGAAAIWHFDEGVDNSCSGGEDVCDSTSNGNDGTFTGAPTWHSEDMCISGKCLSFDGTGANYASLTASSSLDVGTGDFTISAWVKTHDNSNQSIFEKGNTSSACDSSGSKGYVLRLLAGAPSLRINTGSAQNCYVLTADSALSANQWHYVSAVVDRSGNADIYIDGINVKSSAVSSYSNSLDGNDTTRIGILGGTFPMNGFIDEVKIYPYARTAAQVKADYNAGAAVLGAKDTSYLSDGLVGYWKMDEASGTNVADSSGNGNTGTLTNAQETGTSDATSSTTTLVDTDGSLSSTDDVYNGMILSVPAATCAGLSSDEQRLISDYTGSSTTITVGTAFSGDLDSCVYTILHQVGGKFGNGIEFGGDNDYITVADSSSLDINNHITMATWIKPNITTSRMILSKQSGGLSAYYIYLNSSSYLSTGLNIDGTYRYVNSNSTINIDQWQHVAVTFDGNNIKFFINGVLDKTESSYTGSIVPNDGYLYIGQHVSNNYFDGYVDEVRVYNRALSASEVSALYNWAPGPVGYWKMDEGSGTTAVDSSGNGNNAAFTNAPTWTTGKFGSALNFNGTTNYLTVGNQSELDTKNHITIDAWVKPTNISGSKVITARQYGVNNWTLWISGAQTKWRLYTDGTNGGVDLTCSTNNLSANTWSHVTGVWDGSSSTIYINGRYCNSQTVTGLLATGGSMLIGNENNGYGTFMNGVLDDIKVYNYARTTQQIVEDMNAGHPTGGSPIGSQVSYWKFDEQYGQTANDSVGSNDGTLGATTAGGSDDPTWKTESDCKVNGCLSFDGTDDYVKLTDSPFDMDTESFTISTWINATNSPNNPFFVDKRRTWGGASAGFTLLTNNSGYVELRLADGVDGPYAFSGNTNILDSSWHHLAAVVDRTQSIVTLYVDGKSQGGDQSINALLGSLSNNVEIRLGTKDLTSTNALNGLIDEVKIYNSALTADQIRIDYNAGKSVSFGVGAESEATLLSDGAGDPPIAEWKMDEKTGSSVNDTSGNGNTGTISGASWTRGKIGGALSFDGDDDVVNVYSSNLNSVFNGSEGTVEVWIKPDASAWSDSTEQNILRIGVNSSNRIRLMINGSNQLAWNYTAGGTDESYSKSGISGSEWIYMSMTWSSADDEVKYYYNGALQETDTALGVYTGTLSPSINIIGNDATTGTAGWLGLIDQVKVYDYARTGAQIAYDYNRGEPVAWYKMDECEGTTIYDSSGNSNNGTIYPVTLGNTSVGTCDSGTSTEMWNDGTSGKFGASLGFDGTDDYAEATSTLNSIPFTIAGWIKYTANLTTPGFASYTDSNGYRRDVYVYNNNRLRIFTYNGSNAYYYVSSEIKTLNDGQWHHIAGTFDGTTPYVYVDGIQYAASSPVAASTYPTSRIKIGALNIASMLPAYYFNGQIDDVRIYNYALSADQVKTVMNNGRAVRYGE